MANFAVVYRLPAIVCLVLGLGPGQQLPRQLFAIA